MTHVLSAEQLEQIVRKAVRDEFAAFGLRLDTPDHQDEAGEDFRFLRRLRLTYAGTTSKIGGAVVLAIVSGVLWLIWAGAQAFLTQK